VLSDVRYRYLYEAARLGTMRAASEELDVATSSISRQITALEKELGVSLIEGGRRTVKLTEAGETACAFYREKRAHEELFYSKLDELKSVRSGKIVLAVGEAFITSYFGEMLQKFMRAFPGVTVQVKVSGTNDAVVLVRDDEAHVGLIFDLPRDPKVRTRLSFAQPLQIVVHPDHPLAVRKSVALAELVNISIGLPEDAFRIRQIIRNAEQAEGVFLEPELVANSMTLLKEFAKCGRGVTLMPPFLVREEIAAGGLAAIPTTSALLNQTHISLITRVGRQMPTGVYRLMQQLESYLRAINTPVAAARA
jgi:DNA-binding transcriptional LysR family regulator